MDALKNEIISQISSINDAKRLDFLNTIFNIIDKYEKSNKQNKTQTKLKTKQNISKVENNINLQKLPPMTKLPKLPKLSSNKHNKDNLIMNKHNLVNSQLDNKINSLNNQHIEEVNEIIQIQMQIQNDDIEFILFNLSIVDGKKLCQFNKNCLNPDCLYHHNDMQGFKMCNFKENCYTKNCYYCHKIEEYINIYLHDHVELLDKTNLLIQNKILNLEDIYINIYIFSNNPISNGYDDYAFYINKQINKHKIQYNCNN